MNRDSTPADQVPIEPEKSVEMFDESSPPKGSLRGVGLLAIALMGLTITGVMDMGTPTFGWRLGFLGCSIVVISIVVWQACDPFADAAQWLGRQLGIPGSVRGATLDAVSSSMPELFSGLFFVSVVIASQGDDKLAMSASEGMGATIATCAGSAVYNMILIPAICALVISWCRPRNPSIDIDPEVIQRDGLWFLGCELVLIVFLFSDRLYWWMAVVLLLMYAVYVGQLVRDVRQYRRIKSRLEVGLRLDLAEASTDEIVDALRQSGMRASLSLVERLRQSSDDEESADESAGVLFGFLQVPLTSWSVAAVLIVSTLVSVVACYFLVTVTLDLADVLEVPTFFVAVIVTAAASSVPDTFLSVMAARRGDDSGAVSNAFGSNIFDICVCLSIPLLVNAYLVDWGPVPMTQDGGPIPGLVDLRVLLCFLTVITLLIMWRDLSLTRRKAWVLCGLYCIFLVYAVLGSMGMTLTKLVDF